MPPRSRGPGSPRWRRSSARRQRRELATGARIDERPVILVDPRRAMERDQRRPQWHRLVAERPPPAEDLAHPGRVPRAHRGEQMVLDVIAELQREPVDPP